MPSLRDVQHAMRRSLLQDSGVDALTDIIGAGLSPGQRLSIHRNTVLSALANALRLSFPAVHRLVGADFFDAAAQVFAGRQPPRCADLNVYGEEFPGFLQRFEPAATVTYLADVARLEWAVNRALHAPDAPALEPPRLASVAPCDHERVCFIAHPSISLLRSKFPVDTIWRAVLQHDDAAMAGIDLDEPVYLLVERRTDELDVARLDEGAWRFGAALLGGQSLGTALGIAQGVDASALLAQHLLAGHCVAFRVTTEETPS
jgi:hypothetical protein